MNTTNSPINEETTNSSLRTGSQSTISELPNLSPLTLTDKIMVENEDGTFNTDLQDVVNLAAGGGIDLTPYALKTDVDAKDLELKTSIDANTDNINLITNAPLTPDANVLGTEEILSRKPDGTLTTINQSVLAGGGGGGDGDFVTPAELEDRLDTSVNLKALNPISSIAEPIDACLSGMNTNIASNTTNIASNTTKTSELDNRVTNLESGTGGGGDFVAPFHIAITSTDINSADLSITIDLSPHIDQKSFCIDIDILGTERIAIINIIGTDALNGFLEELYLRGNIGVVDTHNNDVKVTTLYIEGVKKTTLYALVLNYGIKCRCTINQISDIFYYAKFDENGDYIDAIFSNRYNTDSQKMELHYETETFFLAFEPIEVIVTTDPRPTTELAYIRLYHGYNDGYILKYDLDVSLLIIDSYCKANGLVTEKIYAQDNVQDYLMYYGRAFYLQSVYIPRYYSESLSDTINMYTELQNTSLLDANFKAISGNTPINFILYSVTAIGKFGKLMDVRDLPKW